MPSAKYEPIADWLRDEIRAGAYAPGASLPSERDLSDNRGVSRMTIRRAYDLLFNEGLIDRPSGNNPPTVRADRTMVSDRLRRVGGTTWAAGRDNVSDDAGSQAYSQDQYDVRPGEAPGTIAAQLGADEDSVFVTIRSRRVLVDGRPAVLADSYIPAGYSAGTAIEQEDTGPGGTYARLADAGHAPARFREDVRVRQASREEAARLELPDRAPVAEITRVAWDADGNAVECIVTVHDPRRYVFRYEWALEDAR